MYDTSVFSPITANRVSSRTHHVRTGISPVGFFLGDITMKKIPLTQGKFALVDDKDYEYLMQWKWYAGKSGNVYYASRDKAMDGAQKRVLMHREIVRPEESEEVDHISHDTLDNQRRNLRICTHRQNSMNRRPNKSKIASQYKGVFRPAATRKWQASINSKGTHYHLGSFESEKNAALTYDRKAKELFGQFAWLNFPETI